MKEIDKYIEQFPKQVRVQLKKLREVILKAAPNSVEIFKYRMPTFYFHGNLVHFAGYKNHIGFYPTPSAIIAFKKELTAYVTSKGAIQFPLDKPIPFDLVERIVSFRVAENSIKAELKK